MSEQYKSADETNRALIFENIRASVENKLLGRRKDFWLFQAGKILSNLDENCSENDDLKQDFAELKMLLLTSPENISPALTAKLQNLLNLLENPQLNADNRQDGSEIYRQLREITENLPMLGN